MRLLRVLWIIFLNRKLIKRAEVEATKFIKEERGFLYDYQADDVDDLIEGTITLGRFSELISLKPKTLKDDFKELETRLKIYDKKN